MDTIPASTCRLCRREIAEDAPRWSFRDAIYPQGIDYCEQCVVLSSDQIVGAARLMINSRRRRQATLARLLDRPSPLKGASRA